MVKLANDSLWWLDIEKHIFLLISNLPLGVKNMKSHGLNGYSLGINIYPK